MRLKMQGRGCTRRWFPETCVGARVGRGVIGCSRFCPCEGRDCGATARVHGDGPLPPPTRPRGSCGVLKALRGDTPSTPGRYGVMVTAPVDSSVTGPIVPIDPAVTTTLFFLSLHFDLHFQSLFYLAIY